MRVVGWAPVPNAWPGSIRITCRPSSPSCASSQDGRTSTRSAINTGSWKSRQRSAQSSGISSELTSIGSSPASASTEPSSGSSPGGAVDRVLDPAGPLLLLDATGRQHEQLGQHASAAAGPQRTASRINAGRGVAASRSGAAVVAVSAARCSSESVPRGRSASSRWSSSRAARDDHVQDARAGRRAAAPRSAGGPAPSRTTRLAGLGTRRDLDLALAVEGRDLDLAAEHRPRRGHPRDRDQVLAVALEALVGGDRRPRRRGRRRARPARRRARRPRSRIRCPDSMPGGDLDLERSLRSRCGPCRRTPRRASRGSCPRRRRPGMAAVRITWPKAVARPRAAGRHRSHVSQVRIGVPGLGAVAAAVLARRDRLEGDLALGAADHLVEGDLDRDADVAAGGRAALAAAEEVSEQRISAAEERPEHVLEAPEPPACGAQPPERRPSWP